MEKNEFYKSMSDISTFSRENSPHQTTPLLPKQSTPIFEPEIPNINFKYEHFDSSLDFEQRREKYRFDLFEETPKRAENIKGSTNGKSSRATEKKQKVDNETLVKRIKAFGLACLVAGGFAFTAKIAKSFDENSVITPHVMSFNHNVVSPNTHRTYDSQNFYYDYDDIAEYLMIEGKDFSRQLYIAYDALGEYQVNKILEFVPGVNSLQDYTTENGFESIDAWKQNEVDKFMMEDELREKRADISNEERDVNEMQSELGAMFSDYNTSAVSNSVSDEYGGGIK